MGAFIVAFHTRLFDSVGSEGDHLTNFEHFVYAAFLSLIIQIVDDVGVFNANVSTSKKGFTISAWQNNLLTKNSRE
jgi:hypothetical protein